MPEPLPPSGRISIPVSHGALEAVVREPARPVAAAVVCHPHPLGGGTMNNNVVYRLAKALVEGDVAALRFKFRGVGASSGTHAHGVGEEEDARAALDWIHGRYPGLPIWMAGFLVRRARRSFSGRDRSARRQAPGRRAGAAHVRLPVPVGVHQTESGDSGGRRRVRRRAEIEPAVNGMADPKRLWVVDAATHLFPGRLDAFESAARDAVAYLAIQEPARR